MYDLSYYRSLTRTMIFSVVLVSFTPLMVISGMVAYQFHTAYRQKVIDHLEEVVEKHKQNIDGFLNERLAEIRVLADAVPFERLSDEVRLEELLHDLREYHGGMFVDLGLIRSNGSQIAYAGPFKLGHADYAGAHWFNEVMEKRVYISDVFLGLRGVPHFIMAVRFGTGDYSWILRATIDFVGFNRLVENIRIGRTGLAFIINSRGEFQTKPRVDITSEIPSVLNLIRKHQGKERISVADMRPPGLDKDVIFVLTPLKNGDWTLVYQQDMDDAFASLHHTRNMSIIVFLLGATAIVMVAVWRSHRVVDRIRQTDREKEMLNEQVIEAGKLASVGELAAGIAHEINNPVAIMVEEGGWISDIMDDAKDGSLNAEDQAEVKKSLEQIQTQGARCKEITHKLLSFARKTDSTVKEVNLNDLITEMAALSKQRAKYANVQIHTDLSPDLPGISTSPSEFQQVMLNLINNALDAMKGDGGDLYITSDSDSRHIRVRVQDTGHGIPQANLARIFDPFFTTKPVGKGTGLGLSICYGIIKKMGGDITVSSVVNKGTAFNLILPLDGSSVTNVNEQDAVNHTPSGRGPHADSAAGGQNRENNL